MRSIGVAAFGVTVCVLVPMTRPDAGPAEREKLFAADTHDLVVDGAHVTATIDHPFLEQNGLVHLTLHADKEVQVGLVVLGSTGTEGGRVPDPPRPVEHRTISLVPDRTGQATKDVAIRLHNALASDYRPYGAYTFYVTSRELGERLQKLVDRAGPSIPTGEIPDMDTDTEKLFSTIYAAQRANDDDYTDRDPTLFAKGSIAVLHGFTRPATDDVALTVPDRVHRGEEFSVTVAVRNPTASKLDKVMVAVDVIPFEETDAYRGLAGSDVAGVKIENVEAISLAPHQRKTVQVHVKAPAVGVVGLRASATCDDCGRADKELRIGTFDAVEVVEAESQVAKQ
jgi:hypothetical protein